MGKNVRVKTWEEFKGLVIQKKPKSIVYIIAQSIPAKNLTGLKLILPVEGTQYILTDYANGNKLRKTGIAIRTDKKGNRFIEDARCEKFSHGTTTKRGFADFLLLDGLMRPQRSYDPWTENRII